MYNGSGQVVGLLFTGMKPQGADRGHMLVTPIKDILDDIKAFSKGGITDIRIPVW